MKDRILKGGDDSTTPIKFSTTTEGGLPLIYFVLSNPEPLGTKFNFISCYKLGLFVCVYRDKMAKVRDMGP